MLSLNEKLSEVQLLRLYERPFMECLYFICEHKFYTRTRVKITRHWKRTLIGRKDRNPFAAVGNFSYTRAGDSGQAKYKKKQSETN